MRVTKEYCDRCGNELRWPRLRARRISTLTAFGGPYDFSDHKYDLCNTCMKGFEKFISGVSDEEKDTKATQI